MIKKIFNKKSLSLLLAFILPIILILICVFFKEFRTNNFFNEGESFLIADMGSQYNSLYSYIKDVFMGNESIFYSFEKGLGGNMSSTVAYYLSSPFNILYIFVSKANIPIMTFIIMLLKTGLCSCFMNVFLNYKYGTKLSNLIFSLSYALMGFTTVYYFNNMWLDIIYMTPLVIMGIDKLIDGNSKFYIITLCLAILFNFYIAYMLCIFCVIYFLYKIFIKYKLKDFKKYKKILFKFIICSIVSALIASFLLIPALLNLSEIFRFPLDKSLLNINFTNIFNDFISKIASKSYIGSHNYTSMLGRVRPVLYVSLFCLLLTFLYFFNKEIKIKEKILTFCVISFFLLSFLIPHLQLFWQAFSFPNGYIDRFSFLYTFFIIYISARNFYTQKKIKLIYFLLFFSLYLLTSLYVNNYSYIFLSKENIFLSVLIMTVYIIFYFIYNYNIFKKKYMKILIFIILSFELILNYSETLITLNVFNFEPNYSSFSNNCNKLNNLEENFYRIDGDYYFNFLDSYTCNYYGIKTSLSTNDNNIYKFFKKNGGSLTYTSIFYSLNNLPILDSLLGVKYIASKNKLDDSLYVFQNNFIYKSNNKNQTAYIYKNPYALSLGYLINSNYEEIYNNLNKSNSFESLNTIIKSLSGINEDVLVPLKKEKINNQNYKFYVDKKSKYIYISTKYDVSINYDTYGSIYINDKDVLLLDSENIGLSKINNNYYNSEISLKIQNSSNKINDVYLYYFNIDSFKKAINILKENELKNVMIDKNTVSGNIKTSKDSIMFLSIPYDKGFNIYVDGKKVNYNKTIDGFISFEIKKGKHNIYIKYHSKYFVLGSIISVITLISLILYFKFYKK